MAKLARYEGDRSSPLAQSLSTPAACPFLPTQQCWHQEIERLWSKAWIAKAKKDDFLVF
ncbi:hypothetical protein [Pajaroellobacter abortibovis]|nr:hypothetical protein [Pajaroellobacter abortibovis]